jgi:DNA-binding response OmpR family regulator
VRSTHHAILLIDDSASVREVLRLSLESEGYQVLEAADGREGVRLFREHRPAVTIVDIVMPEKDGLETVKEILAIDPAAVIFTMSGRDTGGDFQAVARQLGAKRGFEKPLRMDELIGAVRLHLRTATARFEKVYKEGIRITVQDGGILIEAVDYHTKPLFLDEKATGQLGLSMDDDEVDSPGT